MLWWTSACTSAWLPHRPAGYCFCFRDLAALIRLIRLYYCTHKTKHILSCKFFRRTAKNTCSIYTQSVYLFLAVVQSFTRLFFLNVLSPLKLFYYGFLISFKPLLKYYKADWWLLYWINFDPSHEFNNWRPCWEARYSFHDREIGLRKKNWYM